ncbi:MAG: AAA family ATPase [Cyanobacteria bacterium P01_A01_bin.80]
MIPLRKANCKRELEMPLGVTEVQKVESTFQEKEEKEYEVPIEILEKYIAEYQESLYTQQKEVLKDIVQWYFEKDGNQTIALIGCAGSGKSYTAQRIVGCIKKIRIEQLSKKTQVALAAPTHKAVAVLEEFSKEANLKADVATIHSFLHTIPGKFDEKGRQKLTENKNATRTHLRKFDLGVVDECSMITPELEAYVFASGTKVIWLGDDYQLPYVSDDEENLGEINLSPIFTNPEIKICKLTEVIRYAGNVAKYANYIRNNMGEKKLRNPRVGVNSNLSNLTPDEWEETFISMLSENPKNVRAICYSNVAVRTLAKKARKSIYKDEEDYHIGEIISAKENVSIQEIQNERLKKINLMHSCEEGEIIELEKIVSKIPHSSKNTPQCEFWKIKIETSTSKFTIYTPTSESLKSVVRPYLKEKKQEILKEHSSKRGVLWAKYYELLELMQLSQKGNTVIERIQYAGVLTIHQAQGSGFEHVFVDARSCYAAKNPYIYGRLLYTAITRTKKHLYINLNWGNNHFENYKDDYKEEIPVEVDADYGVFFWEYD